ncbi:alpha-L-fucosidase [Diplogelasinospora grovesii]|uniref:Alpha-L-fucosidase n=1 Tax=Diplogelasinospora grovesii TaxID=303347 RepID=A0AAN6MWU5_9PEZI|nr:alpha-L-fucosidase [Diplogelasinospora grovesii]
MDPSAFTYDPTNQHLHLHYPRPAQTWSEALPVGNGRLGAMVYGRPGTELLQLNEDSVWYGGPQDRTPRDAARHLPELRRLVRAGQHAEAEDLVRRAFFATPHSMRHYEPAGQALLEFGHDSVKDGTRLEGYQRWLDIGAARASTVYRWCREGKQAVSVRRDVIASGMDNTLLFRLTASEKIEFVVRLNRTSEVEWETNEYLDSIHASDDRITLHATPGGKNSNRLCIVLGAAIDDLESGGSIEAIGNCLVVRSSACTIAIDAETTFRQSDPEKEAMTVVRRALRRGWKDDLAEHTEENQSLFHRIALRMYPDACATPTAERISGNRDPGLAALYHNYGRYLLISSGRSFGDYSRSLPANLQGIWNPSFAPPWGSKYTININLQMNYWPAAASNLAGRCVPPMVGLLERMAQRGRVTAQTMYNCRGWCAHHNTDIWADTDPQDRWMPSTLWPLGGVWLTIDMLEILKVDYIGSLHQRLAPLLQGCVEFLLDFLVESECGRYLVTNPSLSPENTFIDGAGKQGILCEGSAMDMTLVRWAFDLFLWTASLLATTGEGSEPDLRAETGELVERVKKALERLPPMQINTSGLIQEWGLKDYKELEPGHRHVSHLLGLYPGRYINTPELRQAAREVLKRRAEHGGGHTGWSRAWLFNLHARLGDREQCAEHMDLLLQKSTMPNMLDDHPPFQIDGNFGGCAGVLECLVQSNMTNEGRVRIELLPACPKSWARGVLKGVLVLGGWKVDFEWLDGLVIGRVTVAKESQQPGDKGEWPEVVYPAGEGAHVCFEGAATGSL